MNQVQHKPSARVKHNLNEHVSYSERFPVFGAQYFEFGAQYFPSLPLYDQSQQPTDASHRFAFFKHWCFTAGGKESIARQILETVRNSTHVHVNFFLKMTDTMTSQNIDLSSWDILYLRTSPGFEPRICSVTLVSVHGTCKSVKR
jgi:hypothetical protein